MQSLEKIYYSDEFRDTAMKAKGLSGEDFNGLVLSMKEQVMSATLKDPIKLFFQIIDRSEREWKPGVPFPLLGDWHHFLVPGIVLSALRNSGYEISDKDIAEGIKRAEQAKVSCGFTGVCGGANSIGIVGAIVKKVTPLHDDERQELMRIAARVLESISRVKRRCCLMSSFITLKETIRYLSGNSYFLPLTEIVCPYSSQNSRCAKDQCLFHHTGSVATNGRV